jgi:hypothetical protein
MLIVGLGGDVIGGSDHHVIYYDLRRYTIRLH